MTSENDKVRISVTISGLFALISVVALVIQTVTITETKNRAFEGNLQTFRLEACAEAFGLLARWQEMRIDALFLMDASEFPREVNVEFFEIHTKRINPISEDVPLRLALAKLNFAFPDEQPAQGMIELLGYIEFSMQQYISEFPRYIRASKGLGRDSPTDRSSDTNRTGTTVLESFRKSEFARFLGESLIMEEDGIVVDDGMPLRVRVGILENLTMSPNELVEAFYSLEGYSVRLYDRCMQAARVGVDPL
jgi:hypothetical protein